MIDTPSAITRRELLKKGVLVGVAALWVTPIVQTIGMGRAHATATSPQCMMYTITWVPGHHHGDPFWRTGLEVGCLPIPAGTTPGLPPQIESFDVSFDDGFYAVTYPDSCTLVPSGDPTPDDLVNGSAALSFLGHACSYADATQETDNGNGTRSIRLGPWHHDSSLDRIELVLKCCG